MKKLGFILDNCGPNELAYRVISSANNLIKNQPGVADFIVFFNNIVPNCMPLEFASMNMVEAYDYDGVLVATDLLNASKMLNFPAASRKIFYVWDLEWIRLPNRNYDSFREIYCNEELDLFCRSKTHQFFIQNAWGREAKIVEYCDIEELVKWV